MFPHPDTIVDVCTTRYQDALQLAAQDRLAASARRGEPAPLAWVKRRLTTARSWLGMHLMRLQNGPPGGAAARLALLAGTRRTGHH